MDTSVNDGATHTLARDGEASALAELRKTVSAIGDELSTVIETRSRALKKGAEAGANSLRRSIRRQPAAAMGVATLAGAVLAVVVMPRRDPTRRASRWTEWSPITRADLHDVGDRVQRSLARATNAAPLTSSLERLIEAMGRVESKETFNKMLQKTGTWLQQMRSFSS
jgi:hypothetical protein